MNRLIDLPPSDLGFTGHSFDRLAELRDDEPAVALLRNAPDARAVVIAADTPVLQRQGDGATALMSFAFAATIGKAKEVALLGRDERGPIFGILVARHNLEPLKSRQDVLVTDLRSIAVKGLVDKIEINRIGTAKALLDWHRRHRFCANCGAGTRMAAAGWRRECDGCGAQHFPRTDPVSIMLAHRGDFCLMGRQPRFAPGMYSCLAGFIEPGETIEGAVRRELREEAGIAVAEVKYLFSQPWPFPTSLMIGCHARATSEEITIDKTELEDARWFSREECAAMLAGRHGAGLTAPPPLAIAHHLLRAWVEEK